MGLPASRPRSGPSPHPRSAAAAAALSRLAGLATRLCHRHRPRWTWPAPAVLCGRSGPPQPGAPPIGAPEPAITSTSSACRGQGGVGALAPAAGGTGRGLGQRPAGRCGGRGPAGFSRPRRLAAARFPAVLCRAARARPQLGRSSESTRGFELPTPPAKWGGCWRRPRWPRTRPQWRSCKPLGPAGWEGTLRTTVGRSRWPRWAGEKGHKGNAAFQLWPFSLAKGEAKMR